MLPIDGDRCQIQITPYYSGTGEQNFHFCKELNLVIGESHNELLFNIEENLLETAEGSSFTMLADAHELENIDYNATSGNTAPAHDSFHSDSATEPLLNGSLLPRARDLVTDRELEKCTPVTSCFPCVLQPARPSTPEYEPTPVNPAPPPVLNTQEEANIAGRSSMSSIHSSDGSVSSSSKDLISTDVTGNAITVTVKFLHITSRGPRVCDMTAEDKMNRAITLKNLGTRMFKLGHHKLAFEKYSWAVKYCIMASQTAERQNSSDNLKQEIKLLQTHCHVNIAAVQKIVGNHLGVIENCSKAIEMDNSNVKAYYRRAKAYIKLNKCEEAEEDLKKALTIEPKNNTLIKELRVVQQKRKKNDSGMAAAMSKMFVS